MKMLYDEWKQRRQEEANALPIFFAFSMEQFNEELKRRDLTLAQAKKALCSIGNGGYCLKKDIPIIMAFLDKQDELSGLMEDRDFAFDAFYSEMCNHEYGINWQGDYDVCACFGNPEYGECKDGGDYLLEMGYGRGTIEAYELARRKYYEQAEANGWF